MKRPMTQLEKADRIANAIGWGVAIFATLYISAHVIAYLIR